MAIRILIVEDEEGIRELMKLFLQKKGHEVRIAGDGEQALEIVAAEELDVILLDIEMPEITGFDVCEEIRKQSKVPILFVSCRKERAHKMKGFQLGGDDYITKPFDFHELEARIQALLRRNRWITDENRDSQVITSGDLKIYLDSCEVFINETPVLLLHKEYELLSLFIQHPNRVWAPEQLYDHIWGFYSEGTVQTVKVHISNLRRKLKEQSPNVNYIETIRGFGYKLSIKVMEDH